MDTAAVVRAVVDTLILEFASGTKEAIVAVAEEIISRV